MSPGREPPPNHVSVQEAGRALDVNPETIRNWLRHDPPKIAGQVATNMDTGRPEYWVQVAGKSETGAPTLQEKAVTNSQVATRGDVELTVESLIPLIDRNLGIVGSKIDRQRETLSAGQQEILQVVSSLADSLKRQADALEKMASSEERELVELGNLNRWLERLHADAQKDRAASQMLLKQFVEQGRASLAKPSEAASEAEVEEAKPDKTKRKPWYARAWRRIDEKL